MQSLVGALRSARGRCFDSSKITDLNSIRVALGCGGSSNEGLRLNFPAANGSDLLRAFASSFHSVAAVKSGGLQVRDNVPRLPAASVLQSSQRSMSTDVNHEQAASQDASDPAPSSSPRIKFKRLDKTARHIMQILDREAVESVKSQREVPDIKPGYIIQMKVESPENKRRVTTIKGIVIARRNAGLNTTFRLRRLVAGIGVESLFPLYSPNIKEVKILEKKKVRRAKLYYLRDRMNPLKNK